MTWNQGRAVIEQMLSARQLEKVTASRDLADIYIEQARSALASAPRIADSDPRSAYSLLYDAARFALTAILENQGLRPTNDQGAHRVVYDAVLAQLEPPKGPTIRPFNEMRRMRHSTLYGKVYIPDDQDLEDTYPLVEDIIDMAVRVLDSMPVF